MIPIILFSEPSIQSIFCVLCNEDPNLHYCCEIYILLITKFLIVCQSTLDINNILKKTKKTATIIYTLLSIADIFKRKKENRDYYIQLKMFKYQNCVLQFIFNIHFDMFFIIVKNTYDRTAIHKYVSLFCCFNSRPTRALFFVKCQTKRVFCREEYDSKKYFSFPHKKIIENVFCEKKTLK
ncbi:hypothetical protein RFI_22393 [Reticulomyxa filosa]|uniref:Uncharacterized protein n=1 Tax=Reticulomyxa filosa TaxID=46433 RepID=X6MPH3_RETFI|nr:hypothetical protein RFI_22393 [Reticulomyxa filosa]|eukprot:ETO14975.1 hypothetical protein RFI_22393 [Reticulomyxa filosa]